MSTITVRVDYHREGSAWWADSPDVQGFAAAGDTLYEVRDLVHEGIPFYLETDPSEVEIVEASPEGGAVVAMRLEGSGALAWASPLSQASSPTSQSQFAPAPGHVATFVPA